MIPFTGIPSDRQHGITRWRGTHQYSTDRNITRFGGTARFLQRHVHVREVSRRKRFVSVCHDSKPSR